MAKARIVRTKYGAKFSGGRGKRRRSRSPAGRSPRIRRSPGT